MASNLGSTVDHDDVHATRKDQGFDDLESLLTRIGCNHGHFIQVYADTLGVAGFKRMLGINEGTRCAMALSLSDCSEACQVLRSMQ